MGRDADVTEGQNRQSDDVAKVSKGMTVVVIEKSVVPDEHRVRGRIETNTLPDEHRVNGRIEHGWITLLDTETNTRWAVKATRALCFLPKKLHGLTILKQQDKGTFLV